MRTIQNPSPLRATRWLLGALIAVVVLGPALQAQTDSPRPSSLNGINFGGLLDGYYNYNANHPPESDDGNQLRNFDFNANTFSLSMAKLVVSRDPAPVGFRLDLGFGKAFTAILASQPDFKYLEQAYVSYQPRHAKSLEVDFGEFVTSAGAEVIEANEDWNYSRSILFSVAIPVYHVGVRATMPVTNTFTAGIQLVNGWNSFTDNNSGKTIGLTGAWTEPKFALNTNYYFGPENDHTNKGYRNLFDGVLLLTPVPKLKAYINYDYGQNRNAVETTPGVYQTSTLSHWQGVAVDLRYQATSKLAFSPRWEHYSDPNGFTTGLAQKLREFTVTGEYKLHEGLLSRVEYRRDHSNHDFFRRADGLVPDQSTFEVALIAFFSTNR